MDPHSLIELAIEGNNARVVAPRRFGKTSLLHRVQERLQNEGWVTIYVDLLGIMSAEDFSARIERAYTQQLTGPVAQWFAGLRCQLRPSVTAGGGPVPGSLSLDLSAPAREALCERLDLPKKVREKTGDRVHVIFDEFQELDKLPQRNMDQVLRSVIQHHGDAASYVFAGSEIHMIEMMFSGRDRAFYAQAQKVPLEPLGDEPLGEYIVSRFNNTGKDLTAEVLSALLALVLGHPQRAMAAAHFLWDVTEATADLEEWEVAREKLMDDVDDELRVAWAGTDLTGREILARLAHGGAALGRGGTRGGTAVRAREALAAKGVITETQRRYCIVDPLYSEWIRGQRESS